MATIPTTLNVPNPRQAGYDARLDDLLLRLMVTPETLLETATAQPQVDRVNTSDDPEELVTDYPTYSLADLTGGSGLFYAHRRQRTERDATRFWYSRGVDTSPVKPGEVAGFRLLHDVELVETIDGNGRGPMVSATKDGVLAWADGDDQINMAADPLAALPLTITTHSLGVETITGLAAFGEQFVVGHTGGVDLLDTAGTFTNLPSAPVGLRVFSAKRRIIGSIEGTVYELNPSDGTPTVILTFADGYVRDVADIGEAIAVGSTDGNVYLLAAGSGGALELIGEVALGPAEAVHMVAGGAGQVLIGTYLENGSSEGTVRLYVGQPSYLPDGSLTILDLQLLRTWTIVHPVDRPAFGGHVLDGDSIYVTVCDESDFTTVWRYHLGTGALTEHVRYENSDDPGDHGRIAAVGGRLFFSRYTAVVREAETFVSRGVLISALADFYTRAPKSWLSSITSTADITDDGSEVWIYLSTDRAAMNDPEHPSWRIVQRIYDPTQADVEVNLIETFGVEACLKVELLSDGSATPIVQSTTLFAYPQSTRLLLRMPVNISDRVERARRRPIRVKGRGVELLSRLRGLRDRPVDFELFRPAGEWRGIVKSVETTTPGMEERSNGTLVAWVTFEGRPIGTSIASTTLESLLGVGTMAETATIGK